MTATGSRCHQNTPAAARERPANQEAQMRPTPALPPAADPARTPTAWEATFPGTADQLWHVRAALCSLLGGCPVADDVIQLADELAANAITHSDSGQPGGTFTVRIIHAPGGHVRAEVQDQGSTWHGNLSASARHPHGLYLLHALAAADGARREGQACVIWFRIDYPPHPASSAAALPSAPPRTAVSAETLRRQHDQPQHPEDPMDTPQPPSAPYTPGQQPAPPDPASQHLTAIAARLTVRGITSRLTRLGGTPVLTIEEPTAGPHPSTVTVDPDTSNGPGLPVDCTCLWTPAPGTAPEATADTIITVLKAIRPRHERA